MCGTIYYSPFSNYNLLKIMAIQTAGQKTAKATKIRIENDATIALPKGSEEQIKKVLDFLPIEHQRGLEKVKLVDFINDPRLKGYENARYRVICRGFIIRVPVIRTRGSRCRWARCCSRPKGL